MTRTTKRSLLFIPVVLLFLLSGCTNYQFGDDILSAAEVDLNGGCNLLDINYESTILPILQDNCIACHNSTSPAAGYDYSDYNMVLLSVADGSFFGTINNEAAFIPMPPGSLLDSCSVEQIRTWIEHIDLDSLPIDSVPDNGIVSYCDPDTIYFQNTILPLVVSSCGSTGCHDQASHRDGIILTDYTSIIRTGKIKPGDPGDSEFFESLTNDEDDQMPPPPNNPLSKEQIQMIEQWILQGAKDNTCNEGCDTVNYSYSENIWPVIQKYCTGCHSSNNPGGGIAITGYDELVALAGDGSLMGSIRYESGFSDMPPNMQLSDCTIILLQKWIDEGFPKLE